MTHVHVEICFLAMDNVFTKPELKNLEKEGWERLSFCSLFDHEQRASKDRWHICKSRHRSRFRFSLHRPGHTYTCEQGHKSSLYEVIKLYEEVKDITCECDFCERTRKFDADRAAEAEAHRKWCEENPPFKESKVVIATTFGEIIKASGYRDAINDLQSAKDILTQRVAHCDEEFESSMLSEIENLIERMEAKLK